MPLLASGEMVGAIAMTEPDAGSDLQGIRTKAKREGENGDYILNGSKVSNHYIFLFKYAPYSLIYQYLYCILIWQGSTISKK